MKRSPNKSPLVRTLGSGLGLVLVAGASLIAAAPASAAQDPTVINTIAPYADPSPVGWSQGYADGFADVSSQGLELDGESQVVNTFAPSDRVSLANFTTDVTAGNVAWTTADGSDPVYFQVPVFFGADQSFTTLRPVAPGTTGAAALDQDWTTSKAIGNTAAGATEKLSALLADLGTAGNASVLGFGVLTVADSNSIVTGITFGDASYTFEPAPYDDPSTFSISGVITAKDHNSAFAPSVRLTGIKGSSDYAPPVNADGSFTFEGIAPGADLVVWASAPGYGSVSKSVPVTDKDLTGINFELLPELAAGTAKITGAAEVGKVLTATSTGWPAGTKLSYQWGYSGGEWGNPIEGATSATLKVTKDLIGMQVSVVVTGTKDGYAPTDISEFGPTVTAAKKAAAAAPASSSGGLAVYLKEQGVTPLSQKAAGLPEGDLNPGEDYKAEVPWTATDSYVDVYVYSTPTFVGTFPVVNGVAQITLSADVLSELEAGNHTLVVTGQTSGTVQAAALTVAPMLASTGVNAAVPMGAAALLLLLGAALLIGRRRRQHA